MDTLLDDHDLCPDSRILASKHVEAEPSRRWNAIILLVSDDLEQLCRAIAALRADNAELGHMPTDRIREHRSLTNEKLPAGMQHQAGLLLFRLRRHKSHRRPRDRFADCGSVVGIVLAALQIGFYVAWRQQPHGVAERLKPAAPIMCARTRLNADEAGRQGREELQQLRSGDALPDHHRAINIHSVNLKNRLRDIETDRANLAHGRLPSSGSFRRNHPMALDAAGWAPSTASFTSFPPSRRVRFAPRADRPMPAFMSARPSTTLADLFTLLFAANPFSAARASLRRWSSDEFEDGLAHGGQCRSRRRPVDSFFPALLF